MKSWTVTAIFIFICASVGHPADGAEERAGSIIGAISDFANNAMNTAVNAFGNLFGLVGLERPPYTTEGQPAAVP